MTNRIHYSPTTSLHEMVSTLTAAKQQICPKWPASFSTFQIFFQPLIFSSIVQAKMTSHVLKSQ